jgi:hypothetical protein
METVINSNEIDGNFLKKIQSLYANKKVRITVEEVKSFDEMSGRERWKRMQEMQEKHPPKIISQDIDVSELANEVNL